jgi:glucosamine 6-phosphate synthetase-like amidotransferase/phosphosugar isomerase protein
MKCLIYFLVGLIIGCNSAADKNNTAPGGVQVRGAVKIDSTNLHVIPRGYGQAIYVSPAGKIFKNGLGKYCVISTKSGAFVGSEATSWIEAAHDMIVMSADTVDVVRQYEVNSISQANLLLQGYERTLRRIQENEYQKKNAKKIKDSIEHLRSTLTEVK